MSHFHSIVTAFDHPRLAQQKAHEGSPRGLEHSTFVEVDCGFNFSRALLQLNRHRTLI